MSEITVVTISGSFIADSTYSYIIIGNFFDNQYTSHVKIDAATYCKAYYFVDDICVSTDSITCMGTTGIKEQSIIPTQLKIYPNPSKETFNIELPNQQTFHLQVFDITGRKVLERKNATGTVNIDCSSFSSGIYFVQATNNETSLTYKLVKQK